MLASGYDGMGLYCSSCAVITPEIFWSEPTRGNARQQANEPLVLSGSMRNKLLTPKAWRAELMDVAGMLAETTILPSWGLEYDRKINDDEVSARFRAHENA